MRKSALEGNHTVGDSQVERARALLAQELRAGKQAPGSTISVKATAAALRMSGTPVREALERLVGEGLVTASPARGGFSVPRLSPRDLGSHHLLCAVLLEGALREARSVVKAIAPEPEGDLSDPANFVEAAMHRAVGPSGNDPLAAALRRTHAVLAPYRMVEPLVLPD